jgi:para-nitrobenzyl esterase
MSTSRPIAQTCSGPLVGRRSGRINWFGGIPYAAPPLGRLRFRPPEPPARWSEPRDAGGFGPAAMQPEDPRIDLRATTREDCLTLNVWAPAEGGPWPVLFWVHGGANITGGTAQRLYDGASFAEQGLVFVSANYRLGVFGFLELGGLLPELAGSGVNGLRDLIAALAWVRDNIAAFGGDPGQVTLMGESAGGKDIAALAASPAARGLFQRLAVQSGDLCSVAASVEEAAPAARALVEAAGLEDPRQLQRLPAAALLAAQIKIRERWPRAIRPVAGNEILPLPPVDAARAGATRHLSMIVGTCRDESALYLPPDIAGQPLGPHQFAHAGFAQMAALEQLYAEAFPKLTPGDRHIRQLTAEQFWTPAVRFAEAHADTGGSVWMYRFDLANHDGRYRGYAPHAADLLFTFAAPADSLRLGFSIDAPELAARTHQLWAEWARSGRAELAGAPPWPAYRSAERATLLIDRRPQVALDPRGDERKLWSGLL